MRVMSEGKCDSSSAKEGSGSRVLESSRCVIFLKGEGSERESEERRRPEIRSCVRYGRADTIVAMEERWVKGFRERSSSRISKIN